MMRRPVDPLVLSSRDGAVLTLELHRPERMNAVSLELYLELDRELERAAQNDEVRAVILTGSGPAFCVGADLDAHARRSGGEDVRRTYVEAAGRVALRLRTLPKVVVAAVNGHAIGAGLELGLACDLVAVAEEAKLRFPELGLGTFVGGGVTRTLVQRVGRARAAELLYLCPMFTGAEALCMGLVNRAVPAARVLPVATTLALDAAARAPLSTAWAKRLLNEAEETRFEEVLRREAEALLECMSSEDWDEGLRAFHEKREPHFRGR
jgi:enoyl-CoA hydratase